MLSSTRIFFGQKINKKIEEKTHSMQIFLACFMFYSFYLILLKKKVLKYSNLVVVFVIITQNKNLLFNVQTHILNAVKLKSLVYSSFILIKGVLILVQKLTFSLKIKIYFFNF